MSAKAKLHGAPLATARTVKTMLHDGPQRHKGQSRRQWGRDLAGLICVLAVTNVDPRHFADILPDRQVQAITRQRTINHLATCGMGTLVAA